MTDLRETKYTGVWIYTPNTQCLDTMPPTYSKQIVESGQRFQEEVSTFVRELIPSSDEEEQTFIQVEVKVPESQTERKENRSHQQ